MPNHLDLIGMPFRLGARGPDHFDCWGICLEFAKRNGIEYPKDFTPDNKEQQNDSICIIKDRDFERIEKPEPFAIITFKMKPPYVDHCGIILPDCKTFLHTLEGHAAAVNRIDHRMLAKRIEGFYRLRKNGIS